MIQEPKCFTKKCVHFIGVEQPNGKEKHIYQKEISVISKRVLKHATLVLDWLRYATEALDWLTNNTDHPFTFKWICEMLDMDYSIAIQNILNKLLMDDGKIKRHYKETLKDIFARDIILMLAILEQTYLDIRQMQSRDKNFIIEYLEKNNKEYLLNDRKEAI